MEPDGQWRYEAVSAAWEAQTGIAAATAVGRGPSECLPRDIAEVIVTAARDCARERRLQRYRFSHPPPPGGRNVEGLMTPVIDARGDVCQVLAVARDVTDRDRTEAALRQSHKMQAIEQVAASIAHQFSKILQGIYGSLELLREQQGLDAEGHECVDIAAQAARHGSVLVRQLLAFAGQQSLNPTLLRPAQVIADVLLLMTQALDADIQIETVVEEELAAVRADGPRLGSCLFDLALNARDAMPRGGTIRLLARNMSPDAARAVAIKPGNYVCFEVEDTGVGMMAETLARAFEPHFSNRGQGRRSGLSLPMIYGFARQSGGDVRIESAVGKGTKVSLWLPRVTSAVVSSSLATASPGRRGIVLVVHDEPLVARLLSLVLTQAGFLPRVLETLQEALELLAAGEKCHLLVAQEAAPEMNAAKLTAAVTRLRPKLPALLVGPDAIGRPFDKDAFLQHALALVGRWSEAGREDAAEAAARPDSHSNVLPFRPPDSDRAGS
jgi:PAS domain S-box-containing protein